MPLQKLQFRPGVNRESTTLANEGGWFESDKVRFRSGFPEKIGGWQRDGGSYFSTVPTSTFVSGTPSTAAVPPSGAFWGVAKSMWNWLNLAGYNLLSVGTNLKYYIQNSVGGAFNDVTPIRLTRTAVANAFTTNTATNSGGYTTITVNDPGHGAQANDFVTVSSASGTVNGVTINGEYQIVTYVSSSQYTILVAGTATASSTPAVSATFNYQITTGNTTWTYGTGWGAGGWGGVTTGYSSTGWGSPAPAGLGIGVQLRLWSQANFGEDLIINPRGGAMYYWANNSNPNVYDRAQIIEANPTGTTNYPVVTKAGTIYPDPTTPSISNSILVSDSSRFVFSFGCNDPTGVYATSAQDPMQVRWSDQGQFATWTPAITNQAGGIKLSKGSTIISALQTRQEVLVWTDAALYSFQYLGPPYVWGSQIMADNISIISPNSAAVANNVTYWMGADKFYMYSGRVETLPCALRQYIYDNINLTEAYQIHCGTNEGYNEIWWFYPSITGTKDDGSNGAGNQNSPNSVIDRYVIYNHLERTWYYGTMNGTTVRPRTAWLDSPLRSEPTAAISYVALNNGTPVSYTNGAVVYHETGIDNKETTTTYAIDAYVQSSDFDIGDGHNYGFVWRVIPDVTFDGSTATSPSLKFTIKPRQNPGASYGVDDNPTVTSGNNYASTPYYNVQKFTQIVFVRARGRQMAFRVESNNIGTQWQLGTPSIDIRPDGRR
jgi:hypothetical protein